VTAGDLALFIVDADALHAAAGGLRHQDITAEVSQGWQHLADEVLHCRGMVGGTFGLDQPQAVRKLAQMDGRAGHAKSGFELRTYRAELKVSRQHLGAEAGVFVAAVMADFPAKQAGTDSYRDFTHERHSAV